MRAKKIIRAALGGTATLLRRFDDSVMPLRCVFCGTRSRPPERRICRGCRDDLPWVVHACRRCGMPLATVLPGDIECAACQQRPALLQMTVAPLLYEFPVDAGIKALKFGRKLYYAAAFAELLVAAMPQLPTDIDALLPVPLHWRRQAVRGFNQAAELCRPLARQYSLPVVAGVSRCRATPFQSSLAAPQRRRNLANAFRVKRALPAEHVLLVDDVVTTGETTRTLARTLLRSGVGKVSVLAVARAV